MILKKIKQLELEILMKEGLKHIFVDTQCKDTRKASQIPDRDTVRLKGGAGASLQDIFRNAIRSAFRHGNINLKAGTKNQAKGNCSVESVILNINERPEMQPKVELEPKIVKEVWIDEIREWIELYQPDLIPAHLR